MKNTPILYSFRRCPYAIRARMALAYSGIQVELREVKLSQVPAEMLAVSPKATVPVLQFEDGSVLDESLDIMVWALSCADMENWLDFNDESLIRENDESFKPLLDKYKYADRFPEKNQQQHREAAAPFLGKLDDRLRQQPYLGGQQSGLVDIAIMPFIRQFSGVEPAWFQQCEWKALRDWLNTLLASELFQRVMVKYPVWQTGEGRIYF